MLQKIKNYYHLIEAIAANLLSGFPSRKLKVIAVTGTDGKTTTTTLLYRILQKAGYKVALISTVAAYIGDEAIDTGFHVTTPSPFALQKLLRRIANKHFEYVVLETTSHGIDQNRIWGIHPTYAGITNVTHEHLDYHKTFENYLQTKARLLLSAQKAFLNQDAEGSYDMLSAIISEHEVPFTSTSVKTLSKTIMNACKKRFGSENYNFQNAALATAMALELGVKEKVIANTIYTFSGVPGRMEEVAKHKGVRVIVDFAHTPNALEVALQAMQPARKNGRLIHVFGAAGLRDHTKRPLMGEVASRLADLVVLTAEDPRTEDVWSIIAQIKSGVQTGHAKIVSMTDRGAAITFALKELARNGDTVLITGKGHEKSMCYGKTEIPWSDQETVRKIVYDK